MMHHAALLCFGWSKLIDGVHGATVSNKTSVSWPIHLFHHRDGAGRVLVQMMRRLEHQFSRPFVFKNTMREKCPDQSWAHRLWLHKPSGRTLACVSSCASPGRRRLQLLRMRQVLFVTGLTCFDHKHRCIGHPVLIQPKRRSSRVTFASRVASLTLSCN